MRTVTACVVTTRDMDTERARSALISEPDVDRAGGGQAGTSVVDFGGSQFRGANPAPARGGFLGGLFGARPAPAPQGQPGLSNMMNAWQNETVS